MHNPPIIGVHLDLKGMNFKPGYIPQYLADLASQRVNTVLVEYEDVFPYRGLDIAYDRSAVWSRATLNRFLREAKKNDIQVIPLVQCLGHLEYVLGWDRYRRFAEDRSYPSTINVTDPKAVALIVDMLRQVIEAHPDSKYIHLGMDEAHALKRAAARLKKDVLDVWLDHLRTLLPIVESAGKTAYVWTDMLEDHFRPGAFDEFRNGRVIFGTWDYSTRAGDALPWARLVGNGSSAIRVSKGWLDEPENPDAPPISPSTAFTEDYPPAIRKLLEPYRTGYKGRFYRRNFHIDLWTKLGMHCLPVGALRVSGNLSVLPPFNALFHNIRGWSAAVKRAGGMGQIGSSWARGTSWCPPNFCIDLLWPLIAELSRSMGARPKPFWPGIPASTVSRIVRTLGRCREDWRLERQIADEMDELAPRVREHRYEWQSLALMARVLDLQRRAEYVLAEVDYFHANHRPVASEWQRRLREQSAMLREIAAMRRRVDRHFSKRYSGLAYREWLEHLFGLHAQRIRECQRVCRRKKALARRTFAR